LLPCGEYRTRRSSRGSGPLDLRQQRHGITVGQFNLRKVDSEDAAFSQRSAKDMQAFAGDATTDAENDTLFNQHPIDSVGHVSVPAVRIANWQGGRQPAIRQKGSKCLMSGRLGLVDLVDLVGSG
jgi:hypothetical protein